MRQDGSKNSNFQHSNRYSFLSQSQLIQLDDKCVCNAVGFYFQTLLLDAVQGHESQFSIGVCTISCWDQLNILSDLVTLKWT